MGGGCEFLGRFPAAHGRCPEPGGRPHPPDSLLTDCRGDAYVTGSPDESSGNEDRVAVGGARPAGRNAEATSPITPTAARTTIASAYERSGDGKHSAPPVICG